MCIILNTYACTLTRLGTDNIDMRTYATKQ